MIPKTIHYCWFGHGKFTPEIDRCIASWRKYCPDWEIRLWNEENSPMEIKWVKDAYENRYYAFVADYVRFYALYKYGGVYLDTDMLLIRPIDDLLNERMFIGRERPDRASFGIIAMSSGEEFCKMCLDEYDAIVFNPEKLRTINEIVTLLLRKYGFEDVNENQTLTNGLTVFRTAYFYPVRTVDKYKVEDLFEPPYGGFVKSNEPTYAIHLWNKLWGNEWEMFNRKQYRMALSIVLAKLRKTPRQSLSWYKKLVKKLVKMMLRI